MEKETAQSILLEEQLNIKPKKENNSNINKKKKNKNKSLQMNNINNNKEFNINNPLIVVKNQKRKRDYSPLMDIENDDNINNNNISNNHKIKGIIFKR